MESESCVCQKLQADLHGDVKTAIKIYGHDISIIITNVIIHLYTSVGIPVENQRSGSTEQTRPTRITIFSFLERRNNTNSTFDFSRMPPK